MADIVLNLDPEDAQYLIKRLRRVDGKLGTLDELADQIEAQLPEPRPWAVNGTVVKIGDTVAIRVAGDSWKCSCGARHIDDQIAADLADANAEIIGEPCLRCSISSELV